MIIFTSNQQTQQKNVQYFNILSILIQLIIVNLSSILSLLMKNTILIVVKYQTKQNIVQIHINLILHLSLNLMSMSEFGKNRKP